MKTTKTLILTAAMGLATVLTVQANTLFFDFGDTGQQTGLNYNNVLFNSLTVPNAIDSTAASTGIGLVASGFNVNGPNTSGTTTPSGAAAIFDPQATRDNLFGSLLNFNGGYFGPALLTLTGLNPSATYDFTFFGSRTGVGDNRETSYAVQGLNSGVGLLDTANNTANVALVSGISPDAFGNLTVVVTAGPNNNNGTKFFYLGAMQINAIPEPSSMALAALGGFGLMAARRVRGNRS